MKIAIDGNEANSDKRVGINEYTFQLLKALEKLPDAKRHEFTIYLQKEPLDILPKAREGWKYKVIPGGGMWILRTLTPKLLVNKPDLFFTPTHYAPLLVGVPSVISIMDLGYLETKEQFRAWDFCQLKYWGMLSMWQAKKIIAISEATKKDILKHYPWTKGKIEVTPLAYDIEKFKITNYKLQIEEVKKKYGIQGKYILYLGTLKPSKNIEGIVEAFNVLVYRLQSTDYSLVIAGKKGWLFESIFERVKKLGLEDRVVFTDFIPEEDKASLVAGAEVFVSPSFWEGFGIHILEAMAVGAPVVASNVASLPEVVGDAGVLVDPNNPESIASGVETVLKDRDKWSKKALAQAKKFSWEKTARKTLAVLESIRG